MPFIALLIGLPVTAGLLIVCVIIYDYGFKKLARENGPNSNAGEIISLIIGGLPLIILLSLYLGGIFEFSQGEFLEMFKNGTIWKQIDKLSLGILMLMLAGTINVISPFKIEAG